MLAGHGSSAATPVDSHASACHINTASIGHTSHQHRPLAAPLSRQACLPTLQHTHHHHTHSTASQLAASGSRGCGSSRSSTARCSSRSSAPLCPSLPPSQHMCATHSTISPTSPPTSCSSTTAGRHLLGWCRQLPTLNRPSLPPSSAVQKHRPLAGEAKDSFEYLDVALSAAQHVRVRTARFVKSSTTVEDCPSDKHPEFAVIGRSNVGKSSLINTLTDMSGLAKVSKEPGRTRLINHYLINDSWFLVDLPGYGFAKVAKDSKFAWLRFTKNYFVKRDALVHVLLLVDASIPTPEIDVECANWLAECQVPFAIVFTKMDTRKKDATTPQQNILALKKSLSADWEALPICFETSSRTGAGKTELLNYLGGLRELHLAEGPGVQ